MKKKVTYINESFNARLVTDFLPAPKDLVLKEEQMVKVTLLLNKSSVDFF